MVIIPWILCGFYAYLCAYKDRKAGRNTCIYIDTRTHIQIQKADTQTYKKHTHIYKHTHTHSETHITYSTPHTHADTHTQIHEHIQIQTYAHQHTHT